MSNIERKQVHHFSEPLSIRDLFHNKTIDEVIAKLLCVSRMDGSYSKIVTWDHTDVNRYIYLRGYRFETDEELENRLDEESKQKNKDITSDIAEKVSSILFDLNNDIEEYERYEYSRLRSKFENTMMFSPIKGE